MSTQVIKRAIISVYDKRGIVEFARALSKELGVEIISTGGTASLLEKNGISVTPVDKVTCFPEMMDGRVKTLHPKVHAGILANRDNADHMRQLAEQKVEPIDMVVVNLYPFSDTISDPNCTFDQAIEMIDIGGPCMLRAAAKNHKHVVPVCRPEDLESCIESLRESGQIDEKIRTRLACIAFGITADYDDAVNEYLFGISEPDFDRAMNEESQDTALPPIVDLDSELQRPLRYGENPHQVGGLYEPLLDDFDQGEEAENLVVAEPLQGEMSFNNYGDANAAFELCRELARSGQGESVCTFIKHQNACGVGMASDNIQAYRQAYLGDPNAAMGGVLACSFDITTDFAEQVMSTYATWGKSAGAGGFFVEVWIAPSFADGVVELINDRKQWGKRVRLIPVAGMLNPPHAEELDFRRITGGVLVQRSDLLALNEDQWQVVTKVKPTDEQLTNLRLAWLTCKHTKSNAITLFNNRMLLGNGAGQMSRVMSCRIATWAAKENGHEAALDGAVAASDAFFPFRDGPDILMDAGIKAIIQPGGSKRDEDTIAACDERGIAMITTGTRHFRH